MEKQIRREERGEVIKTYSVHIQGHEEQLKHTQNFCVGMGD